MLSIIIPTFEDPFLQKTIDSLLENSIGKIEIIPVLDGFTPKTPLKSDPRVKPIVLVKNLGMRGAINTGLAAAGGKFIMKCDSHCLFGPKYDQILISNCLPSWLVIPRRYSLDELNWTRHEGRPVKDYHYLVFPTVSKEYGICLTNQDWYHRTQERRHPKYDVDDTMTFQGSCWLANRQYFLKHVGLLDDREETYGPFGGEQLEVGLKYWLGGGSVKIVKSAWYAHLAKRTRHYHQGLFNRKYKLNQNIVKNRTWTTKHWMNDEEPGMIHPFSWLVEKFWPVPSWPEDRKQWELK